MATPEDTKPKQLGSLHERVAYAIQTMRAAGLQGVGNDHWQAVFDIETLVAHIPDVEFSGKGVQVRQTDR